MEIQVAEQSAHVLDDALSWQQVRERAWDQKANAFGTFNTLLMRANPRDIDITYEEKRYEPFWHVVCHSHYSFDRPSRVPCPPAEPSCHCRHRRRPGLPGNHARRQSFTLSGVEHCVQDLRREVLVDATSGEQRPAFEHYLTRPSREVDLSA